MCIIHFHTLMCICWFCYHTLSTISFEVQDIYVTTCRLRQIFVGKIGIRERLTCRFVALFEICGSVVKTKCLYSRFVAEGIRVSAFITPPLVPFFFTNA